VVVRALLDELGEPLVSTTLLLPGHEEPLTIGWEIKEALDHVVLGMPEHERRSREQRGREHALAFDRVRVFDDLFRRSATPTTTVMPQPRPEERAAESV